MNEGQALKDVENALRDFIASILKSKYGSEWINSTGLLPERIAKWKEKRTEDGKRLGEGAVTEERLIYYSEFYELETIIDKNWQDVFQPVFDDRKEFRVLFKLLLSFRNPNAHHRDLLPFQKHLVIGISGYFRNQIAKYRSKMLTGKDIFPQLETIADNYGNVLVFSESGALQAKTILHPGEQLEFIVKATDPQGEALQYGFHPNPQWQDDNILRIHIEKEHIGNPKYFAIVIRSKRDYHADGLYDGVASFSYRIYPK